MKLSSREFQAEEYARAAELLTMSIISLPRLRAFAISAAIKRLSVRMTSPEVVLERLATYHEKTAPLKDYYEKQGKLVTVEGQEEVADTSKLTLAAVGAEN